ncbi:hypothetical protein ACFFX1_13060 [Dactylosporangium sucinum]|uniref:hypothetical protein n=1 Tax=Dactylosporangium sucinum TaxID=1424081 RepID=UPI00167EDA2D|nr:hypothetical protein [Dactylosporangium sucinum]
MPWRPELSIDHGHRAAAGYGVYNAGLPVPAVRSGEPGLMPVAGVVSCLTVVAGLPLALRAPQLVAVAARAALRGTRRTRSPAGR